MKYLLTILGFFVFSYAFAQIEFYDENDELYYIDSETDQAIVDRYLASVEASAIEFNNSYLKERVPARVKNKKGNWVLCYEYSELLFEDEARKYSFEFPDSVLFQYELYLVTRKKKQYLMGVSDRPIEIKAIEYTPYGSRYPFRIQKKNGNFVLYDLDTEAFLEEKKLSEFSFDLPQLNLEERYLFTVQKGGKRYFAHSIEGMAVFEAMPFDEYELIMDTIVQEYYDHYLDEHVNDTIIRFSHIAIQNDGKWGAVHYSTETGMYQVLGFHFDKIDDFPDLEKYNYDELQAIHRTLTASSDIDRAIPFYIGQDDYYILLKLHNHATNRWLVHCTSYDGGGCPFKNAPAGNTQLIEHQEAEVLEVWCEDKVGYWNKQMEEVFSCEYDSFEVVHLDYMYGCALQEEGEWSLYDCQEGKPLVTGNASSIEDLVELWLNR